MTLSEWRGLHDTPWRESRPQETHPASRAFTAEATREPVGGPRARGAERVAAAARRPRGPASLSTARAGVSGLRPRAPETSLILSLASQGLESSSVRLP